MPCMVHTANVLYLKISARKKSTRLTLMKHQYNKTSLYKLSKNYWFFALLEHQKKKQSTVSNDHPVDKQIIAKKTRLV